MAGTDLARLHCFEHRAEDILKLGSVYSIVAPTSMLETRMIRLHCSMRRITDMSSLLERYLDVGQGLMTLIAFLAGLHCTVQYRGGDPSRAIVTGTRCRFQCARRIRQDPFRDGIRLGQHDIMDLLSEYGAKSVK
jgi:hypothetical protein